MTMGPQDTGFSQPDPATVDDAETENDEGEVSLFPERGEALSLIDDEVNCRNCIHFPVCAIFKGIYPLFQEWPSEQEADVDAPVDPTNLAIICELFELDEDQLG